MNYFLIIASIGFFLWIIRNTLFWVELWQSKEYRLDRLYVHLRETIQGKRLIYSPVSVLKWLLLFNGLIISYTQFTSLFEIAVCLFYIFEALQVLSEFFSGYKLRRPVKTMKALIIIGSSLVVVGLLFLVTPSDRFFWMLAVDRLVIVIIAIFVLLFALPTKVYIARKLEKAKEHIRNQKKLLVIAVSGSYGKSSTKEFIAQVLQEKYNVVKTIGSNNTPIGIANTILGRIMEQTDIFVVEMGAYKKGEVAELCEIVPPHISVTTSVSDQHLSLFGSLKNAIETEMELVNALPADGLALFNGNNENTYKLYEKTKKKKILYNVIASEARQSSQVLETSTRLLLRQQADRNDGADIIAKNVKQAKEKLTFTVSLNKKLMDFETPLLGVHMIENILPAIFLADHLGIQTAAIKKAVSNLVPPPKTMSRKMLSNGVTLVDDTFNASPESVRAAIKYMHTYQHKKILVLMPLVELGKHGKERHYEIGREVAKTSDYLFVTNKNFYKYMKKGIEDSNGTCKIIHKKTPQLIQLIISLAKKDDVVVFEGKEAGKVLNGLL